MTNVRKTDDKNQIFIVCLYLTTFFRAEVTYETSWTPAQKLNEVKFSTIQDYLVDKDKVEELPVTSSSSMLGMFGLVGAFGMRKKRKKDR